ncbi:MAG: DUF5069 domain-containing protein, partial [Candidatus Eremiobacteraeota bacterium]|nr:DUF5069 domain-containing protein [Candidatus Eremiobacteraeota bacterium]
PPRGPRECLDGLCFFPRVIDKLRGALPGGATAGYLPFTGLSYLWGRMLAIELPDLQATIVDASDDAAVAIWLRERAGPRPYSEINQRLTTFRRADLPPAWRSTFEAIYPAELRERYENFFDLIEADDRQIQQRAQI